MNEKFICRFEAGAYQSCREKQRMEIQDVFSNKVVKLIFVAVPEFIKVNVIFIAVVFCRSHVSYRCIQPDIKKLIFFAWDFETEVRAVTGDVPVL